MQNQNTGEEGGFMARLQSKIAILLAHFSKTEWSIFFILFIASLISVIWLLLAINQSFIVKVPMAGGEIKEGLVGSPRFINPVLAFSDTDRDMTSLVYSGLMRKDGQGGYELDLAQSYSISPDNLEYTFTLKDGVEFHDGKIVTAEDVLFTIEAVKDPVIKSPRKGAWDGVGVEVIDERTIKFTLRKPWNTFLENTTIGILPKHVWRDSPIELNTANGNPIGTGPYEVTSMSKNSEGIASSYTLTAFKNYSLGKPYIKKITLRFYENEESLVEALDNGQVDQGSSISPENAKKLMEKGYRIETSTLPRIFGLFFNQNQNQIFTNKSVVRAIDLAIDKNRIVESILLGYGIPIDSPMPKNVVPYETLSQEQKQSWADNVAQAKEILANDGWTLNDAGVLEKKVTQNKKTTTSQISFTISTGNATELNGAAEIIKENLKELGMNVEVKTFEVGNLNQLVIRPREYDALLFGQIINSEADLYAFWHSSQRKDPGLNIAMYTNATVDKILEDVVEITNENEKVKKYAQFEKEVREDLPAVFLYSPKLVYVVSKNIKGVSVEHTSSPRERFLSIPSWYIKEDNVWKVFAN